MNNSQQNYEIPDEVGVYGLGQMSKSTSNILARASTAKSYGKSDKSIELKIKTPNILDEYFIGFKETRSARLYNCAIL